MKHAVIFFWLISLQAVIAQQPTEQEIPPVKTQKNVVSKSTGPRKPKPSKNTTKPKADPTPVPLTEMEQFEKASAFELAAERVPALEKFLAAFE